MARTKHVKSGRCEWKVDDDGIYQTDCGHEFVFTDDGPVENKMQFCCYCGAALKAKPVYSSSRMRPVAPPADPPEGQD